MDKNCFPDSFNFFGLGKVTREAQDTDVIFSNPLVVQFQVNDGDWEDVNLGWVFVVFPASLGKTKELAVELANVVAGKFVSSLGENRASPLLISPPKVLDAKNAGEERVRKSLESRIKTLKNWQTYTLAAEGRNIPFAVNFVGQVIGNS